MTNLPPAGWQDDPDNPTQYRYWNGQEWTSDFAPKTPAGPPVKRRTGLKVGGAVLAGLLGIGVIASLTDSGSDPTASPGVTAKPTVSASAPNPTPTEAAEEPAPKPTKPPKPKPYKKLTDRQWKQLVKSPDRFAGDRVIVYANVTQFDAATGDDTFRANAANRNLVTYGFWDGFDNAIFSGTSRQLRKVVQGDVLWMKATVYGSFSYDTQIGGETTVPAFLVTKVKVIGSTD